jgi:hypothetical protein
VIDVRVSDDDLFELELVPIQDSKDSLNLVAGIDHKRFACVLVANNGAITAEKSDGKDLVNQDWTCRLTDALSRRVPTIA